MVVTASLLFSLIVTSVLSDDDDWMNACAKGCECKWQRGKKTASCRWSGLREVPLGLSSLIQVLDLAGNTIRHLDDNVFVAKQLLNLQRIYLTECSVERLDRDSFSGLKILVELLLDGNRIRSLPDGVFRDNIRLRELHLSRNPLRKLSPFPVLPQLRILRLAHCQLEAIERKTFFHLHALEVLALDGNKLTHLDETPFSHLHYLNTLVLHGNPWRCDCRMRSFLEFIMSRKLYSYPTSCNLPDRLSGRLWNDIDPEEWACPPDISVPSAEVRTPSGQNATLSCRVQADPPAQTHWVLDGRILDSITDIPFSDQMYVVVSADGWTNLTVTNVNEQDIGAYTCVGRNAAGAVEANVSLLVVGAIEGTGLLLPGGADLGLAVGIAGGCLALITVLFVAVCLCCCRQRRRRQRRLQLLRTSLKPLTNGVGTSSSSAASKNSYQKAPQSDADDHSPYSSGPARTFLSASRGGSRHYPDVVGAMTRPLLASSDCASGSSADLGAIGSARSSYAPEDTLPLSQNGILPARVVYRPSYVTLPRRSRNPVCTTPESLPYDNLGPRTGPDGSVHRDSPKSVLGLGSGDSPSSWWRRDSDPQLTAAVRSLRVEPLRKPIAIPGATTTLPASLNKRLSLPSRPNVVSPFKEFESKRRLELCPPSRFAAAESSRQDDDSSQGSMDVDSVISELQRLVDSHDPETPNVTKIPPKVLPKPRNRFVRERFQDETEEGTEI